jgi:hypothetical protein
MRGLRLLVLGLATAVTLSSVPAKAGLLLEPYLGYQFGKFKDSSVGGSDADYSGATLGARVGATFPILFIALDYSLPVSGTLKPSGGSNIDVTGGQLFAEVGASLPLIRAYLGYGLSNWYELKASGLTAKYEGGTAIKAGVGTTILPMVAINLEYQTQKFDKVGGVTTSDYKADLFMINASLPFEF